MEAHATGEVGARREMSQADVRDFLDRMAGLGIRIWLDGGWAVDACLGRQTRSHADLDIVIQERDTAACVANLVARGYRPVPRDDTRPWNFVLGDDAGHEIDFHVIVIDEGGRGQYGPPDLGDFAYEADALAYTGNLDGRPVDCVPPEWLVRWHTGYELRAHDIADVRALCAEFGIPLPAEYACR